MNLITTKTGLCLELHGREQLWALRAKVSIPRESILRMGFEQEFSDWRRMEVRMPGASIPGKLLAGSYWTEEGWDFLYIKNPRGFVKPKADNVLAIETDQNRFKRIIISYDPDEARKLLIWWGKSQAK